MYNISFQQIEYFLAIVEHRFISRAAEALFVTQPSMSKWVDRLEKELDIKLFTRTHNGVVLTERGKYLHSKWLPIYNRFCRTIEDARDLTGKRDDVLRVVCMNSYECSNILDKLISKHEESHPDISLLAEVHEGRDLGNLLVTGGTDFAIGPSFIFERRDNISHKNIEAVDLFVAISKEHPLAQGDTLKLSDLCDETFYVMSHDIGRTSMESVFHTCMKFGFYPKRTEYVPNLLSLVFAVKKGRGVTISGKIIDPGSESGIRLFPLDEAVEPEFIAIAWRTNELYGASLDFLNAIPGV